MPEQLDNEHHLLSDQAEWDAPAWAMEPELLPRFADAIRILGDVLAQDFMLRATWVGSEVREERDFDAEELAKLVLVSSLNESRATACRQDLRRRGRHEQRALPRASRGRRVAVPVLVKCPRCGALAIVRGDAVRLTCASCALARDWDGQTLLTVAEDGVVLELTPSRGSGDWVDPRTGRLWTAEREWPPGREPFFGAELWLQSECCGGRLLWARNLEHLDYLRAFVAGELREDVPRLPSNRCRRSCRPG